MEGKLKYNRFFSPCLLLSLATAEVFPRALVPDASLCLPTANLTELSGCVAMTDYQSQCRGFGTDEEKIGCYCQQEMLSDFYKCVTPYRPT